MLNFKAEEPFNLDEANNTETQTRTEKVDCAGQATLLFAPIHRHPCMYIMESQGLPRSPTGRGRELKNLKPGCTGELPGAIKNDPC